MTLKLVFAVICACWENKKVKAFSLEIWEKLDKASKTAMNNNLITNFAALVAYRWLWRETNSNSWKFLFIYLSKYLILQIKF